MRYPKNISETPECDIEAGRQVQELYGRAGRYSMVSPGRGVDDTDEWIPREGWEASLAGFAQYNTVNVDQGAVVLGIVCVLLRSILYYRTLSTRNSYVYDYEYCYDTYCYSAVN